MNKYHWTFIKEIIEIRDLSQFLFVVRSCINLDIVDSIFSFSATLAYAQRSLVSN